MEEAVSLIPDHPVHYNIFMQAHHILSEKGVLTSGLGKDIKDIKDRGYNINLLPNLVYLPSTLEGACHLGVQVHKGDHKWRGYNYHDKVKDSLKSLESEIKDCSSKDIVKKIDGIARSILRKINSFTLPLSTAHKDFHPSKESGCKGCVTIPEHRASKSNCSANFDDVRRNHFGLGHHQYPNAKDEESRNYKIIEFKKKKYELEAGR